MPNNSEYTSQSRTEIGRIEAEISDISNPIERNNARKEKCRKINLRHLPNYVAESIITHYEKISERLNQETQTHLTAQLGIQMTNTLGNMKPIDLSTLINNNYFFQQL